MELNDVFDNFPTQAEFEALDNLAKKQAVEGLISQALAQVQSEGRNPTNWEADRLTGAIGATLTGWYRVAINEVFMSTKTEDEVANPEHWWQEVHDVTLQNLQDGFAYAKGAPPR
jgi:hypothetical protein